MKPTRNVLLIVAVAMSFALVVSLTTETAAQMRVPPGPAAAKPTAAMAIPPGALSRLRVGPDLTVSITGPRMAVAGESIEIKVTATNKGTGTIPGTKTSAETGYIIDVILSSDGAVPVTLGVWPGYAGKTQFDFLEDMLMMGGRISNTDALAAGKSVTYTLSVPIPRRTPQGVYCIAAVGDPINRVKETNEDNNVDLHRIRIAPPEIGPIKPPGGVWVMPYAVGDTKLFEISAAGRTTYRDGISGFMMNEAPFGGHLGLRHGYERTIPGRLITYYRWSYREPGSAAWKEFSESVGVHYVKEQGGTVSYPVYLLGPKSVGTKTLYEFKPDAPPTIPGATTYWPPHDWFGDMYSGFLGSTALPDGTYTIKLEVFNSAGDPVLPGNTTFNFIVPVSVAADGTVGTRPANRAELDGGGFIFRVHIDNRHCYAHIDPPMIGETAVADVCGFLLYSNRAADRVRIGFDALHPANEALFTFSLIRGATTIGAAAAQGEVSAAAAGPYAGNGSGSFAREFPIAMLLSPPCPEKGAFAETLHVYAKATQGWRQRLNYLDAHDVRAFALAPR